MTNTARDEGAATWRETPRMSRLDTALDRGYEPHSDDAASPAAHLVLDEADPWMVALRASVEDAERLRRNELEPPGPGHEVARDHLEDMAFALGGPIEYPAGAYGWAYWTDPHGVAYRAWYQAEATA